MSFVNPQFSIVTVNFNNADLLMEVLSHTMEALRCFDYEIIVVDNGSTDGSYSSLIARYKEDSIVRVFTSGKNGGFGYGCNFGANQVRSEIIWFLNSDAWVTKASEIERTLSLTRRPTTGLVGTSVKFYDGSASPQGGSDMSFAYFLAAALRPGLLFRRLPRPAQRTALALLRHFPGIIGRYAQGMEHTQAARVYPSSGVGGASFLINRASFIRLQGFDENFFLYDEDGDLCLRSIKAGFTNFVDPFIEVETYRSATTSKVSSLSLKRIKKASRLRLIRKHFSGHRRIILTAVTALTWRLL